jgi:hypothetical protein
MEIRFELSCLKERPTAELFGSPSSDAIRKIEHICVLDSSFPCHHHLSRLKTQRRVRSTIIFCYLYFFFLRRV